MENKEKIFTNHDYIKTFTADELATFITQMAESQCSICEYDSKCEYENDCSCKDGTAKWLVKEFDIIPFVKAELRDYAIKNSTTVKEISPTLCRKYTI